jgi:hypothetical protein
MGYVHTLQHLGRCTIRTGNHELRRASPMEPVRIGRQWLSAKQIEGHLRAVWTPGDVVGPREEWITAFAGKRGWSVPPPG